MRKLLLPLCLAFCCSLQAQIVLNGAVINGATVGTTNLPPPAGGGGGGWTLIGSGVAAGANSSEENATTPGYNTTGATLIVIAQAEQGGDNTAPTDSKGNTWTLIADEPTFGNIRIQMFYCINPTTDTAQTFSKDVVNGDPSLTVFAFSGGTGTLDKSAANFNSSATTVSPGSVTPTTSNQLIVSAICHRSSGTPSVDSGLSTQVNQGYTLFQHIGNSMAFKVQNPAAAINPTWTTADAGDYAAIVATFIQ